MVSFECNAIYVEDVKDRSNIPKGCNAMYVGDLGLSNRTIKFYVCWSLLKMSKIIFNML